MNRSLCKCLSFKDLTKYIPIREFSLSSSLEGKRNFRKIFLGNKRGTKLFKKQRQAGEFPDLPFYTDVRDNGYKYGNRFYHVPEMIPEFIVPDLTDCKLKPYVSYRTADISESEFTAEKLFEHVYKDTITSNFKKGEFDENIPTEINEENKKEIEDAFMLARATGSDLFSERKPEQWECLDEKVLNLAETKKKHKSHF